MVHSAKRQLRFEPLEQRLPLDAAALRITELMADNGGALLDADGESSDWLEIFNPGAEPVDLTGLHLTDDADELDKWEFPAGHTLAPGGFLVVFASDKDGELAGGELHANFKLSADGEELLLVAADGATVIDAFSSFPAQLEDASYGVQMQPDGATVTLVAEGATAVAHVPTSGALGKSWTSLDFDDASWAISGPTGFGYENSPGDAINFSAEIATAIPSGTVGLYLRLPFTIDSLAGLSALTLDMRYDDGFVAYLNGQVVASANAPDTPAWSSEAGAPHDDALSEQFVSFDISAATPLLQAGQNVLAIHALNAGAASSDMLVTPRLTGTGAAIVTPERVGYLTVPTPGASNQGDAILGFVEAPEVSVPHGFYDTPQSVALATDTPGAVIVYTTDGSTPTVDQALNPATGLLYSGPIVVSGTTVLRARAFKADHQPSFVTASTYLFLDDVLGQSPTGQAPGPGWPSFDVNGQDIDYGIDPEIIALYGEQAVKDSLLSLPTYSISTDTANLFDPATGIYVNALNRGRDWERAASVELIDPSGAEAGFTINAGLRIRGGYSRNDFNPKHAFRLYFRGDYGAGKLEYPLFGDEGTDEYDVLDLRTAQNYSWSSGGSAQNTFLREVFARDLQADLDQPYTRSRYVHLYLDGVYWGVFMTQERAQEDYAESYFGGDESDYDVVKSDSSAGYTTELSSGDDNAWRSLFDLAQGLASNPDNYWAMQGLTPGGERDAALPVLLDVENLIDYMLIIFYTGGFDTGISEFLGNDVANNWFGFYNREAADQGFQFLIHDNEHSLGANDTDTIDRTGPFNAANQHNFAYFNPHFLHEFLMSHPEYQVAFGDRVQRHLFLDGAMTPDAGVARMAERMTQVEPAIIAEAARWGDAKTRTPRNKSDWLAEYESLINTYFPARTGTVINQLRGDSLYPAAGLPAPVWSQASGSAAYGTALSVNPGLNQVYYTSDGSDPRAIGGGLSAAAVLYTGPVELSPGHATLNARAFDGDDWSALAPATLLVSGSGDYNQDGHVNAADYTVWRDALGSAVTPGAGADGDFDGRIGPGDYDVWRANYGLVVPPQSMPAESSIASSSLAELSPVALSPVALSPAAPDQPAAEPPLPVEAATGALPDEAPGVDPTSQPTRHAAFAAFGLPADHVDRASSKAPPSVDSAAATRSHNLLFLLLGRHAGVGARQEHDAQAAAAGWYAADGDTIGEAGEVTEWEVAIREEF